jgi:F-type H+-transporting ATPase subunit gamma
MPNLKDIRRRIKSVKSTQKITQAMKMVAAAKVKRAEAAMKLAKPYTLKLQETFALALQALGSATFSEEALAQTPMLGLLRPRPVKTVALVVMGADRGLCGAYNANLAKHLMKTLAEYKAQGITPRVFVVGTKPAQVLKKYPKVMVLGSLSHMSIQPTPAHGATIANTLVKAFLSGRVDRIDVLSTRYRSMVSYDVAWEPLMPVAREALSERLAAMGVETVDTNREVLLEPSAEEILSALIPMVLSRTLYGYLLEAAACELSARMTAMSNATKNASELIQRLTLVYNKARQSAITQQLLEVVGGAEALK